ncbi:hypothetical protein [Wenyingzhuangia sp. IMCC45467]
MKKNMLFLCTLFFGACTSNAITVEPVTEPITISKEEQIIKLYNTLVIPMFKDYEQVDIPTAFKIDEEDLGINAGAAFGYVEISKGLIYHKKEIIQTFVLSHEVAHIVTLAQAKQFGLKGDIPRGTIINDYKKAEFLADLIAVHLIKKTAPSHFELLEQEWHYLQSLLGVTTFTHPSGVDRIQSLKTYIEKSKTQGEDLAFKECFVQIWSLN